jgi:Prohead core protein serine protease
MAGDATVAEATTEELTEAANWTVGASRDLPIAQTNRAWDAAAAKARMFGDGDTINRDRAKAGHLVYDSSQPNLKGSYKLPFADVDGGTLKAIPAGLRASASRLPQTDVPDAVRTRARAVLDAYFKKMNEALLTPELRAQILGHFGLNEAVRSDQSYEQLRADLDDAISEWPERPGERMRVTWTFSDRLIAVAWWLRDADPDSGMQRHIWEIPWSKDDTGAYTFGTPVEVVEVEVYEPMVESVNGGQRLTEQIEQRLEVVESRQEDGARRVKAIGITADVVNGNRRRYPRGVLAAAIQQLNSHLHESAGQGRLIATGEAEHPSDKSGRPSLLETVVKWEAASLNAAGKTLLEGTILPTSKGKDISALVEHGVPVGVSMRGYGQYQMVEHNGESIQEVTELKITGFDLVTEPSDPYARITESRETDMGEQNAKDKEKDKGTEGGQQASTVNLDELMAQIEEYPEMLESVINRMNFMDKRRIAELLDTSPARIEQGLKEAMEAKKELEERKHTEVIDAAIAEAVKDLPYGELNKKIAEAVREAKPETAEDVFPLVEKKGKEYDAILAAARLSQMGGKTVRALGPVFERETGQPEYTRAAWEINESLIRSGHGHARDLRRNAGELSRAEIYANKILAKFDETFKQQLNEERRRFEEAETTSNLDLPYSVSRTIIEQAYPELIAANVFDFSTIPSSAERLYFETYVGESGATAAITSESVTGDHDTWVALAHARPQPGTLTLTTDPAGTTYAEGTDYVIDYIQGRVMTLSTGATTDGQSLLANYTYDAIRTGENQPIQRAKNTLSFITMTAAADRLATQITSEAIVFSRSQLGYDAVGRTINNLVRQVRRTIDKGVLWTALAAALQQANNSGGTWASGSDAVALFAEKIGYAKVKVENRFYMPDAIVMSKTNADRLSNWDGFTHLGFPNAILNAAGFAGSIKGLPIFSSPEFSDAYVLVVNRELVMHRVYMPMSIKGPFPSFSNGNLVAADQYYTEEYNGTETPVVEKGAYMVVS